MVRSNSYDGLDRSISQLRGKLKDQNDVFLKSEDVKEDRKAWEDIVENYTEMKKICKVINTQFLDMKADHDAGRITPAHYRHKLQQLNDLLVNSGEKIKVPELGAEGMVTEIRKYFLN